MFHFSSTQGQSQDKQVFLLGPFARHFFSLVHLQGVTSGLSASRSNLLSSPPLPNLATMLDCMSGILSAIKVGQIKTLAQCSFTSWNTHCDFAFGL